MTGAARIRRGNNRSGWHPVAIISGPVPVALAVTTGLWWHGFDSTAGQAISCIVNALLALVLLWRARPRLGWWQRAAPVFALAAAALVWGAAMTLAVSGGWPDYASGKVAAYASGLAALLAGALSGRIFRRAKVLEAVMLCVAASLLWGLLARAGVLGSLYDGWSFMRQERFTGLIGNANVTGAMAGALAIFACSRLCAPGGRGGPALDARIRQVPLLLLGVGVVLAAGSRFASLILLALLGAIAAQAILRDRTRADRRSIVLVLIPLAAIVLLASVDLSAVLRERFDTLLADGGSRISTWSHLIDVALRQPLTGYGLGSFSSLNAHFLTTPRFAQSDWALNSAHNLVLQLMLQGGVPFALLIGASALSGLRQVWQLGRGALTRDDWAIGAIQTLLVLNALTDVTLDMPAPVSFALFLAGLVWGRALDRRKIGIARA